MKTLNDIVKAIDALPAEAFRDYWDRSRDRNTVSDALARGWARWVASVEALQQLKRDTNKRLRRANREIELKRERRANVKVWLEDGTIIKGTFVKVTGARDGKGIREVISWDDARLHCRQWLPEHRADRKHPDDLRMAGCVKLDGMWIGPMAQMMTHEFDKVVKIIG